MQIAYMLLVHHQPDHLARLIKALNAPWAYFFIHVDANTDISDFLLKVPEAPNVYYVHERERIFWGGFNIVKATLRLLEASFYHDLSFKYHVLLSGMDYPLKSNRVIYKTLQRSSLQYLSIGSELLLRNPERIQKYWFNDHPFFNPRFDLYMKENTLAGRRMRKAAPLVQGVVRALLQLLPERRPPWFSCYKGSQWWALTRDCVGEMLEFLRENEDYAGFHKYTFIPDEHFFHSIVKAFSFSNSIVSHEPASRQFALHYIDWSVPTPRPKVLAEEDLDKLIASEALFARKFDEVRSAKLLESLDRYRESH